MITLVKTALLCNQAPSDMACIEDEEIAFAFNVECADILNQWEMDREVEREKRQMELLSGQVMTSALGGSPPREASTTDYW